MVSVEAWEAAQETFLQKSKEFTALYDQFNVSRQQLPMMEIKGHYIFDGDKGKVSLAELFEGRPQLLLYHFMFASSMESWPDVSDVHFLQAMWEICPTCMHAIHLLSWSLKLKNTKSIWDGRCHGILLMAAASTGISALRWIRARYPG